MASRVNTVAFQGIDILDIDVQVQMASGLPAFTNVGPIDTQPAFRRRSRVGLTSLAGRVALAMAAMTLFAPAPSPADEHSPTTSPPTQGEKVTADSKAECEAVMNDILPFAQKMLTLHGEFFPFGGAMKPSGEIVLVAGYDEPNAHPPKK